MASIATAFAGLGNALGGLASTVGQGLTSAVQLLTPLAGPAIQAYSLAAGGGGSQLRYANTAMPGGSPVGMPYPSTSSLVPYQQAGVLDSMLKVGGPLFTGLGIGTGVGQYLSTETAPTGGGARLARTIQVADAKGRPRTYVLAPAITPRYRVTMSVRRRGARRCRRPR